MIVDEIGNLPLTMEESNLFFQFVSSRYEKRSTIYTSNKSFSECGEILGDNAMASAVLNRILHHCTVLNIKGESYRLKDRKKEFFGNSRRSEVIMKDLNIGGKYSFVDFGYFSLAKVIRLKNKNTS